MKKSKLIVNQKSSSASTSVVLMALAALFMILGILFGKGKMMIPFSVFNWEMTEYVVLPLLASLLFIACVMLLGKKAFIVSALPLVMAVVSTMMKAFEMSSLAGYIELLICIVLVVIYCCTLYGTVRRFFFAAVTVILIAYHAYFIVYMQISNPEYFYSFSQLAFEIGSLFMYVGFLFAICGATRHRTINPETATVVTPPIPGKNGLSGMKNSAVSAPEPVRPGAEQVKTNAEIPDGPLGNLPEETEIKTVAENIKEETQIGDVKDTAEIVSDVQKTTETVRDVQETTETVPDVQKVVPEVPAAGENVASAPIINETEEGKEGTPEPDYRDKPKKTTTNFFSRMKTKKDSAPQEPERENLPE